MTHDELMIQTLNETVSSTISENINLIVRIKELNQIIDNLRMECDNLVKQYQLYQVQTNKKLEELQTIVANYAK